MSANEIEIKTLAQKWWPAETIIVGPNMVGIDEQPAKGFACYVTDGNGDHVVRPMKGDTLDALKENVLKRAIETMATKRWPGAQIEVWRETVEAGWEVVFHGASRLNYIADSLESLAMKTEQVVNGRLDIE